MIKRAAGCMRKWRENKTVARELGVVRVTCFVVFGLWSGLQAGSDVEQRDFSRSTTPPHRASGWLPGVLTVGDRMKLVLRVNT